MAGLLTAQFERDLDAGEEIRDERWSGRPLRQRMRERAMVVARRELQD